MCIRDRVSMGMLRYLVIGEGPRTASRSELSLGVAVSYTHLDVYKRQGKDRICKVTIYVPGSAEEAVYPALCARYATLKVPLSGEHWVDVNNPSVHKGSALAFLQRRDETLP